MKNILIVETAVRFMPMFIKISNEYFVNAKIYILKTSKNYFEIIEFETNEILFNGDLDLISESLTELNVDVVCVDNYICLKNIRVIKRIDKFKRVIFNIGLYCTSDKIAYAYSRYGSINSIYICLEYLRLKIKYRLFLLYIFNFGSMNSFFYGKSTVLFWNKLSEKNFRRDFPTIKTDNVLMYENSLKKLNKDKSPLRIVFAPSMLGGKNKKNTEAEFIYWSNLAKAMTYNNAGLFLSLSIHPMYKSKLDNFELLNKKINIFNEIFCGFDIEKNNYDLLITDISTLYWIAPLYGLRSQRVDNMFIHKKYYGDDEID
jgi:hypothetical protein